VVRTPLDFDPGTDAHYSNLGYILLGQIIAKVGGTPYDQYVRANVLMPAGARGAALHRMDGKYLPGEALRYLAGTDFFLPPLQLPMADAAGGWSASVLDMIRFLTALDGSRGKRLLSAKAWQQMLDPPPPPLQPRANGTYFGLGWDSVIRADSGPGYFKDGSFYGMRSFMKHTPAGVSWVLLFNASMQPDAIDTDLITQAVREVREVVETAKHPDIDLFGTFP
jgi:CubicO group peptidase (beta-lactamase class C family)